MPNGTAQVTMSSTAQGGAPRWRIRNSVTTEAATMPRTMNMAYARIGTGPRCQTPWVGLGIAARWVTTATLTDAHATGLLGGRAAWPGEPPGSRLSSMNSLTSAVSAVLRDDHGRVLLCQQSQGHRLWGLPGGKIRHLESPIHAAIRDIREETGMESEIVDIVGMYELTGNGCGEALPDVLVYVFRGRLLGAEPAVNSPRISRLAWHDPYELPHPLTATTRIAVADAVVGRVGVIRKVHRDAEPELPEADDVADSARAFA
jgi:ADP-ribose pyrophosphatase YjhB (NUDIX family)